MIIIKTRTKEDHFDLDGIESSEIFQISQGEGVSFQDEVEYHLRIQKTTKELIVMGSVKTVVSYECARCLKAFKEEIKVDNLLYSYALDQLGEQLDLTPLVREEFLLRLPIMPVCSEECRGLCPQCGKNLNDGPCGCHEKEKSSPFDVLDDFPIE
ncbi:MAG: DUF177 domain-containing protein [Candidatus Aureabacteria bacterium]|nr:DUF177 domain-containing protein [Candidatus Auribacterota bacterium]